MLRQVRYIVVFFFCIGFTNTYAQEKESLPYTKKGQFYFYWGYNWSSYTDSDIHFSGSDHNFTLFDVVAHDRPSKFTLETYFNILNFSAPQFSTRFGYFFKDNWEVSLGMDHMKYVAKQLQNTTISGWIEEDGITYEYNNDNIRLLYSFLQYEHTDGLNYINLGLRRTFNIINKGKFDLNLIGGFESGIIMPRSDVTLLGKDRSDRYHLSGYGLNLVSAINFTFFDKYFFQAELKGGYVNMPKVLTSFEGDIANQDFFFSQTNISLGGYFPLFRKKDKN